MPKVSSFFRRVGAGLGSLKKDFGVTALGDYGWRSLGGSGSARYAGSDLDWAAEAGTPWFNGVVALCLQYVTDKVAEPHLRVVSQMPDGTLRPLPKHPLVHLLRWANPEYRGRQLLAALALSYKLSGNAYCVKVRGPGGIGTPRELWYVPHWRIAPLAPEGGGPTEFYRLTLTGNSGQAQTKILPRADVVHFRCGLDPENTRLGMSAYRAQMRAVVSDNEIDTCTAVILRNMGVAGAMVSPLGEAAEITPEQAETLKQRVRQSITGDNRGDILVPSIPVKVDFLSRSPQDMALDTMGERPAQRLCSTFGIDAAVVGLTAAQGEKYGSLRKEARASSYEQGILPMLSVFAEGWQQEVLPDFGQDMDSVFVEYDYSRVKDLQEDSDAAHTRAGGDFNNFGLTLDEYRSQLGLTPAPEFGGLFRWQLAPLAAAAFGVASLTDALLSADDPKTPAGDLPAEDDEDPN